MSTPGETAERLKKHLAEIAGKYPDLWRHVESFRSERGKSLPWWSGWCFLPLSAAVAIATQGRPLSEIHPSMFGGQLADIAAIGALSSWRATQGIYRFHPELFGHVWDTPIDGDLPVELFFRLPEWCVYIETPGKEYLGTGLHGFWAHLEEDQNDGRRELRFLMDTGAGLFAQILHLSEKTIPEALDKAFRTGASVAEGYGMTSPALTGPEVKKIASVMRPCVSLVLYLCSVSEIRDAGGSERQPGKPSPVKTKKGLRLFPPERQTSWEVGYRIGAALQRAYEKERSAGTGEGTHAGPGPHIRKAHWHSFWTGQKNEPEARRLKVKWLPPIPVAVGDGEGLIPTIHPVK